MDSKLSRWCEGVIEAGWLFALIVTPLFFNIHSERVFEPDKITLMRSLALMMLVAWIIKFIDQQGWRDLSWLGWKSENSIWRKPLVLPVFIVAIVYLLSTLISVAPRTSFWGSYQRLQGTYTTISYIIIFALMASQMRTRAQVQRVITTVIITSIPVALYGMLQKFELDPLPWGGDTSTRIAGHMGNAIFIGAYLIMAIPLTAVRIIDSFYNILTDEELSYADVIRSSIYILAVAIQLLALYWSQSRGPLLGLGIGIFAFVLIALVSLRNEAAKGGKGSPTDLVWPFAFMALGFVGLLLSGSLSDSLGSERAFFVFGGFVAVLILAIFIFAAAQIGWRWLWSAWLAMVAFVGLVLILFNFGVQFPERSAETPLLSTLQPTFEEWAELPTIGRLGKMLDTNAGTSQVRVLIWSGALDLIQPHDPLYSPVAGDDSFNFLRPLLGYGPEAMYVAYNSFYPPELANIEARNASPDRSHNETFDALVITGIGGFLAWQLLYITVFFFGFKTVGIANSKRDRNIFVGLWILGAAVMTAIFVSTNGAEYLGVSIPFGSMIGIVLYLVYYALFAKSAETEDDEPSQPDADGAKPSLYNPNTIIISGLIAALLGYYVEIHFGIAIVSTRTHSFAFMALMFVMGYKLPQLASSKLAETTSAKPAKRGRRSATSQKEKGWGGTVFGMMLLLAVIVGTLGFDFTQFAPMPGEMENISSAADLPSGAEIVHRSLFINNRQNFISSPYLFGVVFLTWLFGTLLIMTEMIKDGTLTVTKSTAGKAQSGPTIAGVLLIVVGLIAFAGLGMNLTSEEVTNGERVGNLVSILWGLISVASGVSLLLYGKTSPTVRYYAATVATLGTIMALPLLLSRVWVIVIPIGLLSAVALYLLWEASWRNVLLPTLIVGFFSFLLAYLYMLAHGGLIRGSLIAPTGLAGLERRVFEAERIGGYLSGFYLYLFILLLLGGVAYAWYRMEASQQTMSAVGAVAALVLLIGGFVLVDRTNLNVIQADMTYKRGRPFDQQAGQLARQLQSGQVSADQTSQVQQSLIDSYQTSIAIYERAIEMVPSEDFYYLWLGRAYLEQSSADRQNQVTLLNTAQQKLLDAQNINPLNTDHTANLARLNVRWANFTNGQDRQNRIAEGRNYYQDALQLSPQNSIIRNEYGGLLLSLDGNCDDAIDVYEESVSVDPFYEQSYLRLAETYLVCGNPDTMASITSSQVEVTGDNATVTTLGDDDPQVNLDYYERAADTVVLAFENILPNKMRNFVTNFARMEVRIASQFVEAGEYESALEIAERAEARGVESLTPQLEQLYDLIDAADNS